MKSDLSESSWKAEHLLFVRLHTDVSMLVGIALIFNRTFELPKQYSFGPFRFHSRAAP
jgi:hypothetical protein